MDSKGFWEDEQEKLNSLTEGIRAGEHWEQGF